MVRQMSEPIIGLLIGVSILIAILGILWTLLFTGMFVYAAFFSTKNIENKGVEVAQREAQTLQKFGKDPLSNIRKQYRQDGTDSGLVYANVVYGPSYWHLMIGWFGNMVGGQINILHKVISTGRALATQRLREQAELAGWDEVLNVRIDTSALAPINVPSRVKAVEIFAYGTGVKYKGSGDK